MGPGRTRDQEGTSTYHLFLFLPRTSQWNFEMKRKWLMASHGRQGLINSICISAVIRCSFTRRYWNILKHTHLNHCFFFGLTPTSHLLAPDADNPQPEVVYGFGHPLLGPLLKKKWGGIFTVRFQHWLPQHVNKKPKAHLSNLKLHIGRCPRMSNRFTLLPSDVKCHSTKTSLRKPSSFTDVSDFVKNSRTYDRLKAS